MFLGALDDMSTKTWIEKTKESRVKYDKLFKKYVTDLKEKMKTEADLAVNNPLSQEEEVLVALPCGCFAHTTTRALGSDSSRTLSCSARSSRTSSERTCCFIISHV